MLGSLIGCNDHPNRPLAHPLLSESLHISYGIYLPFSPGSKKKTNHVHSFQSLMPQFFLGGGIGSSPKSLHPSENSPWLRKAYPATPQGRPAGVPWNPRVPAPAPPGPPLRSHRSPRDPTPVSGGFFEGSRAQGDGTEDGLFHHGSMGYNGCIIITMILFIKVMMEIFAHHCSPYILKLRHS